MATADTPLLELRGVSKAFGAVQALYRVDFEVRRGEVMALVGDNGAGKSTLVKSVAGIYPFDEGEVLYDGVPVNVHGPRDAAKLGIEVVYQDLALADNLDVVANMFLGRERARVGFVLDESSMERSARETLDSLSVTTLKSVRQTVAGLSGGQRQAVAVAKSVMWDSRLVILDEPTAALGVAQTRQVLDLVKRLAERDLGVVIVTHNLHDVFEVADRITVLRLGQRVALLDREKTTQQEVVQAITAGTLDHVPGMLEEEDRGVSDRPVEPETSGDPTAARVEPVAADALADDVSAASFGGYVRLWWQGIRAGELGSLPIIVGLLVIVVVFGLLDDTFLTERNFTNLLLQMSAIATIAIGVVFVLLIGEIDLSVAFVSAVGGVVMTLLLRPEDPGWPWWAAILVALICTTLIGFVQALVITKAGVPSFVVTLAGLLIWSGVVLILTTQASSVGTIRIQDETAVGIANDFLSPTAGWVVAALVVVGYALSELQSARTRRASGLYAKPIVVTALQTIGLAAVTFAAVWYVNKDRGVPKVTVILLALLVFWSFVASRTRFGRHVYAVGGSAEASRRAGIAVDRVRIAVFMISGFMAGVGGIMLASRLRSVATNTGGGNLLLLVIASAVIGGTSLFGGVGRVVSALLGALVIASIQNGMDLLGLASGTKFVITGLVLLAAVLVDAYAKRRRTARGVV